jgi:pimeloyl-ACP methyl ester carboxylesterase
VAEEDANDESREQAEIKQDATMKTLGGRQFWGDVFFFREWRIQKHVVTGHHRLLDGEDYRHVAGTFDECRDKLDEIKKERKLEPMSGSAVVLLHGIIRSSKSMRKMRAPFEEAGYTVFSFDYPSTQADIPSAAEYLHSVLESLEGIREINFVVHSMGGLVVRAYLKEHEDKRIKRMVMLGVPNLGANLADRVQKVGLYRLVFGPAGQQLVSAPNGLIASLPAPEFEFAIIAGARGTLNGFNPLIPGDDDGTVTVNSTRLPGAADFITVSCLHSFLMGDDDAIDCSVRFIRSGRLRKEGERHPIPKENEQPPVKLPVNPMPKSGTSN